MSEAGSKNPKEAARADAKAAKGAKKDGAKREINAGTQVAVGEHARACRSRGVGQGGSRSRVGAPLEVLVEEIRAEGGRRPVLFVVCPGRWWRRAGRPPDTTHPWWGSSSGRGPV